MEILHKLDGILWIKASGKLLAHAMQEEMLVPLELAEVKASIQNGAEIASPYASKDELRPSIETAMHAILRHRVVIHVHSINAIAWAIVWMARPAKRAAGRLYWRWIPYAASACPSPGKSKRQWPVHRRPTCSYLEITGWSSADRIARQPRNFCVK